MTGLHRTPIALLSLFVIAAGGCQPLPKAQVTLNTLVAQYNANAAGIPMLAGSSKYTSLRPLLRK